MRRAHKCAALLGSKTAGDDDLAVLGQRFANGRERFLDRGIDEAAGVDDDQIGALIGRRDGISLGFELGKNLLGVDQCLRASQRDESHLGRCGSGERSGPDFRYGHSGSNRAVQKNQRCNADAAVLSSVSAFFLRRPTVERPRRSWGTETR